MKIMVASDLHLEHRNGISEVIPKNAKFQNPDVVILAGDIDSHVGIRDTLFGICEIFSNSLILYTTGNHEYYSKSFSIDTIDNKIRNIETELIKSGYQFRFLNNQSFSYQGIDFYGGCMWSKLNCREPLIPLSDTLMINMEEGKGIRRKDMTKLWEKFKEGLDSHLETYGEENTIVISHFSPSFDFRNPFAMRSGYYIFLNDYVSAPMDKYIKEMKLKAWFYGHSHYSEVARLPSGCLVASCQLGHPEDFEGVHSPKPFTVFDI